MRTKSIVRLLAVVAGVSVASMSLQASSWPQKPIIFVNPFAAGGGIDADAKSLAAQFDQQLGTRILSEYKAGDGGTPDSMHDLVIRGGRVIDPETGLDAVRDVAIDGDRITVVSTRALQGRRVVEARGLVVAPGFIDLHAHGQSVDADRMRAFDGVTTVLELESGILPVAEWYAAQARARRVLNHGASAAWTFARIAEIEGIEPKPDLLWFEDMFKHQRWVHQPAGREQVKKIVARIERGLREGALGIGINAGYAPAGGYAELLEVHRLAARLQVPTFTHISCVYPDDPGSASECVGQIISMSAATGAQVHICHINSSSLGIVDTTVDMIEQARDRGLRVSTESCTYGASSTVAGADAYAPGNLERRGHAHDIEYNGQRLDPDRFAGLRARDPGAVIVFHFLDLPRQQALLDRAVLTPAGVIASDGMPWIDTATGKQVDPEARPLPATAYAHPRGVFNFLGNLIYRQVERPAPYRLILTSQEAKDYNHLGRGNDLFVVRKNQTRPGDLVRVEFEGSTYSIPAENQGHSALVMSVVQQILNLNKSVNLIPTTSAVVVR